MELDLRTRHVELTDDLRNHVDRRLRFALTRFGSRIRRLSVGLTDVNGPRGGVDIQCRVQAVLASGDTLVVRAVRTDPFTAVAGASERIAHTIMRRLDRRKDARRGRATPPRRDEPSNASEAG